MTLYEKVRNVNKLSVDDVISMLTEKNVITSKDVTNRKAEKSKKNK